MLKRSLVTGLQLVILGFMAVRTSAFSKMEAVKATLDVEPVAAASEGQGFLEDINFKSFFEEVGLIGSHSAPEVIPLHEPGIPEAREAHRPSGKITDTFQSSGSNNHFTVVRSDDHFAAESSPFDDFHAFGHDPSNPYAASHSHRDYISPYASSSRDSHRVAFNDYGPPEGFFDTEFINFGSGGGGQRGGSQKSISPKSNQETQSESKVEEEGIKHDPDTKKCEKVHKDGMTCEICKDDFGGFSEHCSHSLNSGKDQKYANSRRTSHDEVFDPSKTRHRQHSRPEAYKASEKSATNDQVFARDNEEKAGHKKSPTSQTQDHSSSSSSTLPQSSSLSSQAPPHSSSKPTIHHSIRDNYNPHESFPEEYKHPSKTNQNTYHPAPENSFASNFGGFKHDKDTYDFKNLNYEIPQDSYDSLKETEKLQQKALKAFQNSLKLPTITVTRPPEKKASDTDTKKYSTVDISDKVKGSSSYSSPTPKSSPSPPPSNPSPKTLLPESANAIKAPKLEEKGEIAVFAKKSVPRHNPNAYAHSEPKKVYQTTKVHQTKTGGDHKDANFGKDHLYDPFPDLTLDRHYDPYDFDDLTMFDDSSDLASVKTLDDYRRHVFASFSPTAAKIGTNSLFPDVVENASKRHSYPSSNTPHGNHHNEYRPLDPAENFKVIGQMVKQFSKKDRTHCKKKITKDGMTCYVCPNKHGQVDEECVYEKTDPQKGVHMMYKEETSY